MSAQDITSTDAPAQTAEPSVGASTPPPPLGLTGWLARVADRFSNSADRSNLAFHEAIEKIAQETPDLLLADFHSDTLLWGVDPWSRRTTGHMDVPRLISARIGLQVFGGPTWTPLPMKNSENALCVSCESIDQSNALFPSEWVNKLRRSKGGLRRRRAFKLAERFQHMLDADRDGRLRPVFTPADLDGLAGAGRPGPIGVMLSLEGLHWLEPDASEKELRAEISALRSVGYRMLAPTHRFSNGMGGSSEDCSGRIGLTSAGRAMLKLCWRMGLAVDLAHASPALIREAAGLALTQEGGPRPLIVSHGGVRGAHRAARNLRDADIRAVASTGGVVGVGVWREAIGFSPADSFDSKIAQILGAFEAALNALRQPDFAEEMQDRYGRYDPYEHLALGSDFDGAVETPFDVTGVSWLWAAALSYETAQGPLLPPEKLPLWAGENTRRVLRIALGSSNA